MLVTQTEKKLDKSKEKEYACFSDLLAAVDRSNHEKNLRIQFISRQGSHEDHSNPLTEEYRINGQPSSSRPAHKISNLKAKEKLANLVLWKLDYSLYEGCTPDVPRQKSTESVQSSTKRRK